RSDRIRGAAPRAARGISGGGKRRSCRAHCEPARTWHAPRRFDVYVKLSKRPTAFSQVSE
ncbi:MAG: hypothetical protein ACREHD_10115, partial [Pirellulales bacterium]